MLNKLSDDFDRVFKAFQSDKDEIDFYAGQRLREMGADHNPMWPESVVKGYEAQVQLEMNMDAKTNEFI